MHITRATLSLIAITIHVLATHALPSNSEAEADNSNNSGSIDANDPDDGWFGLYRIPDCKDHLIRSAGNWPENALGTTYDPRPTIVDSDCHPWAPAIAINDGSPSVGVQFGGKATEFKALKVYKLTDGCSKSRLSLSQCCGEDGYLGVLNRNGQNSDFNAKTNVGQLRGQCVNANSTFWEMQFYQAVW